jgi:1-acyl-sn-glycerol-3-phosphate acyltransferase
MVVANHSGQVPIDGMLLATSFLADATPPRLIRGMVERWAPALPFVSTFFSRMGQVTGDSHNCRELLNNDQAVMVFPEGTNGSGKTIFERYQLQDFGTGFLRLALETKSPIMPTAIIGCEETLPSLTGLRPLARLLRIPYLPIIATGIVPLPTKVTIRFGQPIVLNESPDCSDAQLEKLIESVKKAIADELTIGLSLRGEHIFTQSGCSNDEAEKKS